MIKRAMVVAYLCPELGSFKDGLAAQRCHKSMLFSSFYLANRSGLATLPLMETSKMAATTPHTKLSKKQEGRESSHVAWGTRS